MLLIGYARVSTDEQDTFAQIRELRRAGCVIIFEERAIGASRSRPKLASALAAVGHGDTLVVVRIDRLA
jgi:DNA invertase Pin-like site-specific DNA recombinase